MQIILHTTNTTGSTALMGYHGNIDLSTRNSFQRFQSQTMKLLLYSLHYLFICIYLYYIYQPL